MDLGASKANSGVNLTRNRVTSIRDANYFRVLCWMNKRYARSLACSYSIISLVIQRAWNEERKGKGEGRGPLSGVKPSPQSGSWAVQFWCRFEGERERRGVSETGKKLQLGGASPPAIGSSKEGKDPFHSPTLLPHSSFHSSRAGGKA